MLYAVTWKFSINVVGSRIIHENTKRFIDKTNGLIELHRMSKEKRPVFETVPRAVAYSVTGMLAMVCCFCVWGGYWYLEGSFALGLCMVRRKGSMTQNCFVY